MCTREGNTSARQGDEREKALAPHGRGGGGRRTGLKSVGAQPSGGGAQ